MSSYLQTLSLRPAPQGRSVLRTGSGGSATRVAGDSAAENVSQNPHEMSQCAASPLSAPVQIALRCRVICRGQWRTEVINSTPQLSGGPPSSPQSPVTVSAGWRQNLANKIKSNLFFFLGVSLASLARRQVALCRGRAPAPALPTRVPGAKGWIQDGGGRWGQEAAHSVLPPGTPPPSLWPTKQPRPQPVQRTCALSRELPPVHSSIKE